MKLLFYIAYLVCVSSLPISSVPERHLKPINQSLVGLQTNGVYHVVLEHAECGKQVKNLGNLGLEECALKVQEDAQCVSGVFMWSESYQNHWGCRCCTNAENPIHHDLWDLYAVEATLMMSRVECGKQVKNLGDQTVEQCALDVEADDECISGVFMYSKSYPVWGCRCCTNAEDPITHNLWNLYKTPQHDLWNAPGFMHVARDRYCKCADRNVDDCGGHHNRLSSTICKGGKEHCAKYAADGWSWGSHELCANSCINDNECEFYLWSDNSDCTDCAVTYTCATFKSCGITTTFQDGDGSNLYLRLPAAERYDHHPGKCNAYVNKGGCHAVKNLEECLRLCDKDPECQMAELPTDQNARYEDQKYCCLEHCDLDSCEEIDDDGPCGSDGPWDSYTPKKEHKVAKATSNLNAKCTEGMSFNVNENDFDVREGSDCATKLVANKEKHGIQCCSDTAVAGFTEIKKPKEGCWGSAHFGKDDKTQPNPYVIYSKNQQQYIPEKGKNIQEGCQQGSWSQAEAKCKSVGGRLCTVEELGKGCADQTGCWYDQRLVWTSDVDDGTNQIQTSQIGAAAIEVAEGQSTYVAAGNDKYCCSSNCDAAVILDTRCDPTKGCDLNQPEALWFSQENCESSCSSNPNCKFYLWRQDSEADAVKTCATFNNCDHKSAFNDGDGGCIYEKNVQG